jgi:hypothetical protein
MNPILTLPTFSQQALPKPLVDPCISTLAVADSGVNDRQSNMVLVPPNIDFSLGIDTATFASSNSTAWPHFALLFPDSQIKQITEDYTFP